jgi:hypothetical protein
MIVKSSHFGTQFQKASRNPTANEADTWLISVSDPPVQLDTHFSCSNLYSSSVIGSPEGLAVGNLHRHWKISDIVYWYGPHTKKKPPQFPVPNVSYSHFSSWISCIMKAIHLKRIQTLWPSTDQESKVPHRLFQLSERLLSGTYVSRTTLERLFNPQNLSATSVPQLALSNYGPFLPSDGRDAGIARSS